MAKNTRYTYIDMANEIKGLLTGEIAMTAEIGTRVIEKLDALIATQQSKADYNKANPKKSTAKGASEDTKAKGVQIAGVLPNNAENAVTASEINSLLGTEFTALQVANAVKFLDGAVSCKVIRESVNAKGLKAQKEYTAYYMG